MYTADPKMIERLQNDYCYRRPSEEAGERMSLIRQIHLEVALRLTTLCPPSRELSVALTHLDESSKNAVAAIARNEKHPPA